MIFEPPETLRQRIAEVTRREPPPGITLWVDTSDFMAIAAGDILRLSGSDFLVTGQAREGRFGIDEQPKYWVKIALDLTTGARKIIKMVFRETFDSRIGTTVFRCVRSPEKEGDILQKMHGHPNFMQGRPVHDAAGNLVRIIDFIYGPSLYAYLRRQTKTHEAYYHELFPEVMPLLIQSIEAIAHLHRQGMHHGDIRADHLIIDSDSGAYAWIDFDYAVDRRDYDVYCLGNVLQQAVGKGRHAREDIRLRPGDYPYLQGDLTSGDMSLMFRHRVMNLRKLFPYIPAALNGILMRFAAGAADPYTKVDDLLADLRSLFPSPAV
jgi:serine/threonine protein kinase